MALPKGSGFPFQSFAFEKKAKGFPLQSLTQTGKFVIKSVFDISIVLNVI